MKKILLLLGIIIINTFFNFAYATNNVAKTNPSQNIHVAFTIDNNYSLYATLAINSILRNNTSNSNYTFYIVETDLTDKNIKKMKDFVEKRGHKIEFIDVDPSIIDKGHDFFDSEQWAGRLNNIALARILLPDLLPKNLNKVLYLDADIMVCGDLLKLYNTKLGNYPVAMAKDPWVSNYTFIKMPKAYYNSGVILMDLNLWRKYNITKKLLNYVDKNFIRFIPNPKQSTYFNFPDQDLINIVLQRQIKPISNFYNSFRTIHYNPKTKEGTVIVHWTGHNKPWFYFENIKANQIYYNYWKECDELKHQYYYYRYIKRWPVIFNEFKKNYGKFTINKLLKTLYVPFGVFFELTFLLLPITIPLLLGVYACAFIKRDFARYRKWFCVLLPLILCALFSTFTEFLRPIFGNMTTYYYYLIFLAVYFLGYFNFLVYDFARKKQEQKYILFLFLFIVLIFVLFFKILT